MELPFAKMYERRISAVIKRKAILATHASLFEGTNVNTRETWGNILIQTQRMVVGVSRDLNLQEERICMESE